MRNTSLPLHLADVKPNDSLIAENLDCVPEGDHRVVQMDYDGTLFIFCAHGRHHLRDLADPRNILLGLTKGNRT